MEVVRELFEKIAMSYSVLRDGFQTVAAAILESAEDEANGLCHSRVSLSLFRLFVKNTDSQRPPLRTAWGLLWRNTLCRTRSQAGGPGLAREGSVHHQ